MSLVLLQTTCSRSRMRRQQASSSKPASNSPSIAQYFTAFRNLTSDCNFEQYTKEVEDKNAFYVDRALRDHLVMSVLDNDTRCLLLRSAVKTLDEALTIVQGVETSRHDAGAMTSRVASQQEVNTEVQISDCV